VRDLAAADLDRVLALWSGLGYYRRARGLHEGARDVVARFGGELPASVEQLRTIKGIGPYTAGAIASLAFGIQTPLVDGNVIRVLARLHAIQQDARQSRVQRLLWSLAESLVPADHPGPFNEAMMELGATVCLPREPLCLLCPLASTCEGHRLGLASTLPVLAPPKAPPLVHAAALVARQDGAVLLGRRRSDALFGGLWEPPTVEAPSPQDASSLLASFATSTTLAGEVQHTLSHRKMRVMVFAGVPVDPPGYPAVYEEVRWVQETELHGYGISTLARKLLARGAG
jgi:A/G-specific adenine glycosylase